jgi:hypothetical protein
MTQKITYIDNLMKNYSLDSDSYSFGSYNEDKNQTGGQTNVEQNSPNGGFPPIYLCKGKPEETTEKDDATKREFKTHKTAVSIKSILEKRRKASPFIKTTETTKNTTE